MTAAVVCALCGFEYEPGGEACRNHGCPLASGSCQSLHCPRCGYAVPDPRGSAVLGWLGRIFRKSEPQAPGPCALADLPVGQTAIVERVDLEAPLAARLATYGLVRGAAVSLDQRRPACVVTIGKTTLGLERAVARGIRVRPGDHSEPARSVSAA